jgi:hypothetical protein
VVKFENAADFNAGIDKWLVQVDTLAVGVLRGLSVKLFEAVLRNSPQYSGNAVANWKYSVNNKDVSYDNFFKELFKDKEEAAWPMEVEPYSKTNPNDAAEAYAISNAVGRELQVQNISDVIYISNSVTYKEWLSAATEANLREVNHVGHLISQASDDVVEGHLFITTTKAEALALERIA